MPDTSKVPTVKTSLYRKIMVIAIFVIIILTLIFYIIDKIDLNEKNCRRIAITDQPLSISSIPYDNSNFKYPLRDFYIKAAYNCCCGGNFKNDYVNLCALENAIQQGARLLDFEIYSVNNKPVVAASSINNHNYKETYNQVPFDKVIGTIRTRAFSSTYCPNDTDPLILFFRVNSKYKHIYDEMGNIIMKELGSESYLMGPTYGNEYNGNNIGSVPLNKFKKKVIIAVLKEDGIMEGTKLESITNITAGKYSSFLRLYREQDIAYTTEIEEIQQYNRLQMSIVLPNVKASYKNINSTQSYDYGCQMVGMSCQNFDEELQFNNGKFETAAVPSAFVLKPSNLRATVTIIPAVEPVPKTHSCIPLKRCMMKGKKYTCEEY